MHNKEKTKELFELLASMTDYDKFRHDKSRKTSNPSDRLVLVFIFIEVAAILGVGVLFFGKSLILIIVAFLVIFGIIFLIAFCAYDLYKGCRDFHKTNLDQIKASIDMDSDSFCHLCHFDKETLEYVTTQYRHQFYFFDKKLSLFLIIFGVLIAASIFTFQIEVDSLFDAPRRNVVTVMHEAKMGLREIHEESLKDASGKVSDNSQIDAGKHAQKNSRALGEWLMLIVFIALVFFGTLVKRRKRPDQIIALLECVIRLKQDSKKI